MSFVLSELGNYKCNLIRLLKKELLSSQKRRKQMNKTTKKLILFRGAPGCGKSTFIKNNGLDSYTLSTDLIRLEIFEPKILEDGALGIPQNNKLVFSLLKCQLRQRLIAGDFTVIDSTNSTTAEILQHKVFADKYGYTTYLVDMTNLPIEVCKRQNSARLPEYKRVPEWVIDKMYRNFAKEQVPENVIVIKPEQLMKVIGD